MTPHERLMTCGPLEFVDAVMHKNDQRFSVLPVVRDGRICGLFDAARWFDAESLPHTRIGDDFERLAESHHIDSGASIMSFAETADERPTRLVVADQEIVGLVCPADLQKLPVRAALFCLITALELAMASRIQATWPAGPDWLCLLCEGRRRRV